MEKFDIKKACKSMYGAPRGEFVIIDTVPLNYFMIDGTGDPNRAPAHAAGVQALYAASYTLKFMSKADLCRDYTVPPLEGLWWAEDMDDFVARRKDRWCWTMMIAVPDFVEKPMVEAALHKAMDKKGLAAIGQLRFERLTEGPPCRPCISAPMTTKGRFCGNFTSSSCPRTVLSPPGTITRSIWAIRARPRPSGSRPSCGSRS